MDYPKPTPLNKFTINTLNNEFSVNLKKKLFSQEKLINTVKTVLKLEVAIIITIIVNTLLGKTSIYNTYIKNMDPAIIKIGNLKIKTRKLVSLLIKYSILVINFAIIHYLI